MVHPWHFRGFPTDQRTAGLQTTFCDPLNHTGCGIHIQFAGGIVVEEEQRLSALNDQIVNAHGNQVDTDGIVTF